MSAHRECTEMTLISNRWNGFFRICTEGTWLRSSDGFWTKDAGQQLDDDPCGDSSPEHGVGLQVVSRLLPLLRVLWPGGLPVSGSGPGPSQRPPRHLADGPEREQADGGPQQILHGSVDAQDPADVQQQHPDSAATGNKKTLILFVY